MSSRTSSEQRFAVIGAGVAGLACAHELLARGCQVVVLDKGRLPGGRLSSRTVGEGVYDLGAQYFTARDNRFLRVVHRWLEAQWIAPWNARIGSMDALGAPMFGVEPLTRFVGLPSMGALAVAMSRGLEIRSSHRVDRVERIQGLYRLSGAVEPSNRTLAPAQKGEVGEVDFGRFDGVAICLPPHQAASLLDIESPRLAEQCRQVEMLPCFAVGCSVAPGDSPLDEFPWDAVFVGRQDTPSALSWIARDSSKPGRPAGERWVLHANERWTRIAFDQPHEQVALGLVRELERIVGAGPILPSSTTVQRWVYARARDPIGDSAWLNESRSLGVAGDWLCGGRVEGAFLSGVTLAHSLTS